MFTTAKVECFRVKQSTMVFIGDEAVLENSRVLWREDCSGNTVKRAEMLDTHMAYSIKVFSNCCVV